MGIKVTCGSSFSIMTYKVKYGTMEEIDAIIEDSRAKKKRLEAKRILRSIRDGDLDLRNKMGHKERELSQLINKLKAARRYRLLAEKRLEERAKRCEELLRA